jgi:hypothetical protein
LRPTPAPPGGNCRRGVVQRDHRANRHDEDSREPARWGSRDLCGHRGSGGLAGADHRCCGHPRDRTALDCDGHLARARHHPLDRRGGCTPAGVAVRADGTSLVGSVDALRAPSLPRGPSTPEGRSICIILDIIAPVSPRTNGCPEKSGAGHRLQCGPRRDRGDLPCAPVTPIASLAEVDRPGVWIASTAQAAYDLCLLGTFVRPP